MFASELIGLDFYDGPINGYLRSPYGDFSFRTLWFETDLKFRVFGLVKLAEGQYSRIQQAFAAFEPTRRPIWYPFSKSGDEAYLASGIERTLASITGSGGEVFVLVRGENFPTTIDYWRPVVPCLQLESISSDFLVNSISRRRAKSLTPVNELETQFLEYLSPGS